jgi:methylenetetrahydrofolate reductase (NADPH)
LSGETELIADHLAAVNKKGVLTVNSQPSVNCAPSTDPRVGWGHPDGYVFQKAYLEFFTSEESVVALLQVLRRYPGVDFQIINHDGSFNCTNKEKLGPNAVTWGVFQGCEIKQPTIVDPISFQAWSEEAFSLWKEQWAKIYEPDSESRKVIEKISESYYLINMVDNDFPLGNCLWNVLEDMFSRRRLNEKIQDNLDLDSIVTQLHYFRISEKDHV